jgi:hypothetical protein
MAVHIPVNHPLRNLYRTFAGIAGLYIFVFGIVGLVQTWGTEFFGRGSFWVLGLRTNLAFSILSIVVGAVVATGAIINGNIDRFINLAGGVVFLVAGMLMLALLQTDLNLLNFTVATCIASYLIGLALGVAGLYGKVGPPTERGAEESFRHGGYDPKRHVWQHEQGKPHRGVQETEEDEHRFA